VGELREGPMQLNLVTRALCRVLLGFVQKQAARRGIELRYSFGDKTSLPSIAFPVLAADRMVMSKEPAQLPIDTDEDKGTWEIRDGKLVSIDRSELMLDEEHYVTIMFATSVIDLHSWCLTGIPGVRNLDLRQFWGNQALHVALFEDDPLTGRRIFLELELASVSSSDEVSGDPAEPPSAVEAVAPTTEVRETVVELTDAAVEEPEAISPDDAPDVERMSFYSEGDAVSGGSKSTSSDDPEPGDEDDDVQSRISTYSRGLVEQLNRKAPGEGSLSVEDISHDVAHADGGSNSVDIPWYLLNGAGDLWWCIVFRGRTCWRHNSQLCALCSALGAQRLRLEGNSSVQDLEAGRRLASRLLEQGCSVPGLLEEFTSAEVAVGTLLSGEVRPRKQAMFIGVVEAEGRIAERYARLYGETLRWRVPGQGLSRSEEVAVELRRCEVSTTSVAGAQALVLRMPQRGFVFLAKDPAHQGVISDCLQSCVIRGDVEPATEGWGLMPAGLASPTCAPSASTHLQEVWAAVRRHVASFAAMVPGQQRAAVAATTVQQRAVEAATSVQQRAVEAATSVQQRAASAASTVQLPVHILRPAAPWHDPLQRWPKGRIVINNAEPWLQGPPAPVLALSAGLLRCAVDAQGGGEPAVRELTARSCALKCASLAGLGEQDLWCFWVNTFHCLIIHAQLVAGRPRMVQHMVSFFNNCSYVVAGHVLSLAEIEHCILRKHMTKPRMLLVKSIVRIWPRTEEDFETRPCMNAPPCPAACFSCRPDWRLNLVLNAANHGSADAVPVFEAMTEDQFERAIRRAIRSTLDCCGSTGREAIELPYSLYRYRDDAPPGAAGDTVERRWARALVPELLSANVRITFGTYGWTMRPRLDLIPGQDDVEFVSI